MGKLEYGQITAQLSPKQVELYDDYLYLLSIDERTVEKNRNKEHVAILESLAAERIQKVALLAACKLGKTMIERLQWDNLDDESEFDFCNSCNQRDYEGHKPECDRKQAIEQLQSAIELAGESGT